jgi:hypothetical protein
MNHVSTVGFMTRVDRIKAQLADLKINPNNWPVSDEDRKFLFLETLAEWETAKKTLEAAKADEMRLRKEVVEYGFENKPGTQHVELENGYKATAVQKINYGWIKKPDGKGVDKKEIDNALAKIEADGPVGELIADRLVSWTPALSLTEYNQLDSKYKQIIDAVIVKTDAAPTLEIKAPKGSK